MRGAIVFTHAGRHLSCRSYRLSSSSHALGGPSLRKELLPPHLLGLSSSLHTLGFLGAPRQRGPPLSDAAIGLPGWAQRLWACRGRLPIVGVGGNRRCCHCPTTRARRRQVYPEIILPQPEKSPHPRLQNPRPRDLVVRLPIYVRRRREGRPRMLLCWRCHECRLCPEK